MGDLSKDFDRIEFECECGCGFDVVDAELVAVLQDLRNWTRQRIDVTSGARCEDQNFVVDGAMNSKHKIGKAADIVVKNFSPLAIYRILDYEYDKKYGIGLYDYHVHIDVRKRKSRWDKRSKQYEEETRK